MVEMFLLLSPLLLVMFLLVLVLLLLLLMVLLLAMLAPDWFNNFRMIFYGESISVAVAAFVACVK
jgi:hypothetical protein